MRPSRVGTFNKKLPCFLDLRRKRGDCLFSSETPPPKSGCVCILRIGHAFRRKHTFPLAAVTILFWTATME
jgi:hypothetical protein